jgi:hypothetical protein
MMVLSLTKWHRSNLVSRTWVARLNMHFVLTTDKRFCQIIREFTNKKLPDSYCFHFWRLSENQIVVPESLDRQLSSQFNDCGNLFLMLNCESVDFIVMHLLNFKYLAEKTTKILPIEASFSYNFKNLNIVKCKFRLCFSGSDNRSHFVEIIINFYSHYSQYNNNKLQY